MDYYFRSKTGPASPSPAMIRQANMRLVTNGLSTLTAEDGLIWEYQPENTAADWGEVKNALANQAALAIWVDDYAAFCRDSANTSYLAQTRFLLVPSRQAKRDLILNHDVNANQIGVRELLDLPTNWQFVGEPPFSVNGHRWNSQWPQQVFLKQLHRQGGWGLVADDSGQYNLSHSLAGFLAAGLPVVALRGSAAGDFVSQQQLGIVIDDLAAWQVAVAQVDEQSYQQYARQVTQWGARVRQDWFTKRALNKVRFHCHITVSLFADYSSIYRPAQFGLQVMDSLDTASFIQENRCSVARLGDGEIALLNGAGQVFQEPDPQLRRRLDEIVRAGSSSRLLVCLSDAFHGLDIFVPNAHDWWAGHLQAYAAYYQELAGRRNVYGNTMLTRPYMDFNQRQGAKQIFAAIRRFWQDRDILLVEGYYTRSGVGNDLYANAHSVERIICPSKNAWSKYREIEAAIKKHGQGKLVLVMLGMAATVIAADLASWGQVIDLGHLDSEYEWYQMGATERVPLRGKHTAEMNYDTDIAAIHDEEFQRQIVANLAGRSEE